jgi:hypothetical protein
VVVKVHPPIRSPEFLHAIYRIQRYLAEHTFPCPTPLLAPTTLGHGHAAVEDLVDEGDYRDAHQPAVRRAIGECLARLIALTAQIGEVQELGAGAMQRRHPDKLWPIPHSAIFDFEATAAGAEWIDSIASRAWRTLQQSESRRVIGHTDWSVKHFRFIGDTVRVIYDWDSLRLERETRIVGGAAATFTYTEFLNVPRHPNDNEVRAFVDEYEAARGTPFTIAERGEIGAAVTYSRAYGARCEHALDPHATEFPPGSQRDMLIRFGEADLGA